MKTQMKYLIRSLLICASLSLVACVQAPTEKQSISDMRPQISFNVSNDQAKEARVQIDGLDMGNVGSYIEGISTLRILPGTHLLRVSLGSTILLEEKFYLADGVNRSFNLKRE